MKFPIFPILTNEDRRKTKTIVLFGETGAGKSSLVNLMAGKEVAYTSPDMQRCTLQWKEYTIDFDDGSYKVFDTIGLEEPQLGIKEYLESVENAYKLVKELDQQGGIDLLLFCVRAGRVTATLQSNYRLFHEFLCEKKVPIVLAITNLEREHRMEDWWERNRATFAKYDIQVAGHACITAANRLDGRHKDLYEESRVTIRNLVKNFTADGQKKAWMGGDNLFVSLMRKLKGLLTVGSHVRRKDLVPHLTRRCGISQDVAKDEDRNKTIVLFGETGAGKSSLVNLMAGEEVARTSPDMERCTLQWKDYAIGFDGGSYTVFDTSGLEEPQLGTKEYLESVDNAYRLIKELDGRGGIDLLLFCVRASKVTATLQSNYRLFHEFLCEKKVPIVLAVTHLEKEQRMEDWWEGHRSAFEKYHIRVAGHACLTAANGLEGRHKELYEESRVTIRSLVKNFTADGQKQAWMGGDNLFVSLMRKLKVLLIGSSIVRRKDLVPRLTKRCGISPDVAKQVANMIKQN
ncbi:P-loop containing nucleoside triphosphate hydrolase protein [Suillus variegatus]|nr:P-loop containing nucleoside triphosphate hydrolase protein [Suillus variegatus]